MRSPAVILLVVLGLLGLPGFTLDRGPLGALDGICSTGSVKDAAAGLLGQEAELVDVATDSALVLTPGVAPGVRQRLVSAGADTWCPASAVNLVATATGTLRDPVALASRAATVLPAAHFDDVTVLEAAEVAPGTVAVRTHARTNGVVADWTVEVDDLGVRRATWRATEFAVEPFDAQFEGLTALPGAEWTYARTPAGLVEPTTTIAELAEAQETDDPSPTISVESQDGFTVHVFVGDATFVPQAANTVTGAGLPTVYAGVAPDPGVDSGQPQVDFLRIMGEAAQVNLDDFHAWGWRQGWLDEEGAIYVDGALSAYCLACVLVSEYFNVHMSRGAYQALGALGYSYPDERTALIDIIGHEMVHNYQNAYGKPQTSGGGRHNSYSEGMARFSETLHDYSSVSHQPGSLVYADDTNGCNGWQGGNADQAFAAGPLTGQSYDACYFWMTVHAAYGIEAFLGILEHSAGLPGGRPWEIYDEAIAAATGAPLEETLANFAAMALTGRGYEWGAPADPESPALDWALYLDRWAPPFDLWPGGSESVSLRDGGMAAFNFTGSTTVVDVSEEEGHAAALVVDDGATTTITLLRDGDAVEVAPTESAWIVLINAGTELSDVTISLS